MTSEQNKPIMDEDSYFKSVTKIGVIADIQYCDEKDGTSFDGSETRRYRETLNVTRRAAKVFEAFQVGAVLQLGDAIDGKSRNNFKRDFCERICPILEIPLVKTNDGKEALSVAPRLDVMGNHELYCATRQQLRTILRDYDAEKDLLCYSKVIANGRWRLITLDSYGVSLLGHEPNTERSFQLKEAESIISRNNPNLLQTGNNVDWFEGLPVEKHRYVSYNGALGLVQLEWLKLELMESWREKQYVVIFSHIPMSGWKHHPKTIHWDMEEVLKLIKENGSHVVACVGGHRHSFEYQVNDEFDTHCHHLDLPSPLVTPVGGEAHAVFEFSVRNIPVVKDEIRQDDSMAETGDPSKHVITSVIKNLDLTSLNDSSSLYSDEKLVFVGSKIFKNEENIICDKNDEVAIITVHGFGDMPRLMHLARQKPIEW